MRFLKLAALAGVLGLIALGARRRAQLRDRLGSLFGRGRVGVEPSPTTTLGDDQLLKAKIESEAFRDVEAAKGDVNVNVEVGVVYLRGQVEDQTLIQELEQRVRAVQGVNRVENLLHTPGTEAPTHSG